LPVLPPAEQPGSIVGRYRLLEQIGEGGFGVVFMAEQREPVKRKVALKIIKLGMDTRQVVARFEAERQALALMDHPNIAKVLDAGATETGRPYFVMELVRGVPITRFCDENQATTAERLELFMQVCTAIQHAHQKGIIHRDIKPNNVLVTLHDDRPVPKVIDFGIAKATQQELTDKTIFTRYHEFLGTPAYMSPEQTQLSGLDLDTRTDIYSLGVLLYELLTGRTPFDAQELLSGGYDEIRRRIRDQEPLKPSTKLNTLAMEDRELAARKRKSDPRQLNRLLKGDLDWIVMKALEKDRTRRYESASAFAQDVRRYLSDEPVSAVAPSFGYRLQKFARRHRTALPAAAIIFFLLVAGTAVSVWLAMEARREAARARTEQATAEAVTRFLNDDLFSMADPAAQPEREVTVRALLDRASRQLPGGLKDQPLVEAAIHDTLGRTYSRLSQHEEAVRHLHKAHEIYLRELGERHEKTIEALLAAASSHDRSRSLETITAMTEKAHRLAMEEFGAEHPLTIRSLTQLGWRYYSARRRTEAFQAAEEAWAAAQRAFTVPEAEAYSTLILLARRHSAEGDVPGGERLLRRAVEAHLKKFGPQHQATFRAKEGLAAYLYDRSLHLDEAEKMYRESLAGRLAVYGEEHDSPQYVRRNLALLLEATGRAAEAWRELLAVVEKRPALRETHHDLDRLRSKLPLRRLGEWTTTPNLAWRFLPERPGESWREIDFDDRAWLSSAPADARELWARCRLELSSPLPSNLRLVLRWHGTGRADVFINGAAALREDRLVREGPRYGVVMAGMTALLKPGPNVISLRVRDITAGAKLDPQLGLELLVSEPAVNQ
jgi:hypothetical protein